VTHPNARSADQDFIDLFEAYGPHETARRLNINVRRVYDRRVKMEKKYGRQLTPPYHAGGGRYRHGIKHAGRIEIAIPNGEVLVGSDAHYWPGIVSTAHRAFVKLIKEIKPKAVIMNGDVMDGASISRHPPIGWESRPTVIQEIETCKERLEEISDAAGKDCRLIWPLGNHDARFETRLAQVAPEYAKVHGVHLQDHFPDWEPCWSTWINDNTVVKHRFKGGMHATHNNALWSGKSMVTGHLHSLKWNPIADYNGRRYGVDTGTMAEPDGPQFADYTEDNPKNWCSGFAVLTYWQGRLLAPELAEVFDDGLVSFRGKVIEA